MSGEGSHSEKDILYKLLHFLGGKQPVLGQDFLPQPSFFPCFYSKVRVRMGEVNTKMDSCFVFFFLFFVCLFFCLLARFHLGCSK